MAIPMTSRQRLQTVLSRGIPDQVPRVDISFWPETLERWHAEGLPAGVTPDKHFSLDRIECFAFDGSLGLPEEIVEEQAQWRVRRDANGLLIKEWIDWRISYSPPVRMDCRIKTWDDWRQVKGRLQVQADRIGDQRQQAYQEWRRQDRFVAISPIEPMWFLIEQLTGFETGLPLLAEQPDLAVDILHTYTDFILGMCQLCVDQGLTFDGLWFFSDLCYRNGMLFSPKMYRELLRPCHQRVKEWCRRQDIPLLLHCDGDVREFLPLLVEVGFDAIQPLEVRCGNDVRELKRLYGTNLVFFGNISTDVMAAGTDAEIEEEVVSKVRRRK